MNLKHAPARTLAAITLLATACAGLLFAGPLDPPAGPVAPTGKTLTELEPRIAVTPANISGAATAIFRINQAGSYYLTGNITGEPGKHGIQINTSGVTLDLNGFEIRGVAGSLDGINVSAFDGVNITIKNGSLRSWGDCGLEAEFNGGHPPACVLTGISTARNGRDGIALWGTNRLVSCSALENTEDGIDVVGDSVLIDCNSSSNGDDGFETNSGCTLTNCVASGNTGRGFYGFAGCTYTNCSASSNATGFVSSASIFNGCAAYTNTANGFDLFNSCALTSCNAYRNGGIGIDASSAATVIGCTVAENTGIGINTSSGTTVRECNATNNVGSGIVVSSNCHVRDNTAVNNGAATATFANIRAAGSDNRIEGNNCTDAPIGIDIAIAGNVIIRNTCASNTINWVIAANNAVGPILDRTAVVSAAISGNSAPDSTGSTHPNANFTY